MLSFILQRALHWPYKRCTGVDPWYNLFRCGFRCFPCFACWLCTQILHLGVPNIISQNSEHMTELQISCVFAFLTLWKRVKTHVLSDQSVHITHTYCCVSKLSKFGAYLYSRVHNNTFLSEKFPVITSLYTVRRKERPISQHRCQKWSDWMFRINHPIAVNITNKCGLRNK